MLCLGATARAHGPDLAVTEVLTWISGADNGAPRPGLVRLTRGAAWYDGETLRFLCPAAWGGPQSPLMAVLDDQVWLGGLMGPAHLGSEGTLEEPGGSGAIQALIGGKFRALASDGIDVLALTTGGALWRIAPGAPTELATSTPYPDHLVAIGRGRWVLAVEDQGTLTLSRVAIDGLAIEHAAPFLTSPYRATPTLLWLADPDPIAATGRLWVRGATSDGFRLDRVAFTEHGDAEMVPVATSSEPIFGPVMLDGDTYLVLGGQPLRLIGDTLEPLPETPRLFCLHAHPALGLLACVGTDLFRYDPATGVGALLLSLSMLRPPTLDGLDATERFGCQADWIDAAKDAGLPPELESPAEAEGDSAPDSVESDVAVAPSASSGCTASAPNAELPAALLIALAIRRVTRRSWRSDV